MTRSKISVLGGDQREVRVARLLAQNGYDVAIFGAKPEHLNGLQNSETPRAAVENSNWIICPSPGLGLNDQIYAPDSPEPIILDRSLLNASSASQGGLILGHASPRVATAADELGIQVIEMKADRALAVVVGTAVAEAVIEILIGATSRVFRETTVLILGYGATGSAICDGLVAVGCKVLAASRNRVDAELSRRRGCLPVLFAEWPDHLSGVDVIVNTVPDMNAIPPDQFPRIEGLIVVDISSPPGGIDHQAAEGAGVKVIWARGLAGRRAHLTVGDAQYQFVQRAMGGAQ